MRQAGRPAGRPGALRTWGISFSAECGGALDRLKPRSPQVGQAPIYSLISPLWLQGGGGAATVG